MGQNRSPNLAAILVGVITFLVFARSIGGPFVLWDDPMTVFGNEDFNPPTIQSLGHIWTSAGQTLFIPLTYTAWWLLAALSQVWPQSSEMALNPLLFHAANVLLHALAAATVVVILRRIADVRLGKPGIRNQDDKSELKSENRNPEFAIILAALVWSLHPLQVEPVAWVTGLKDVLSGLLVLLGLWQWIIFAQEGGRRPAIVANILMILAILAKPAAITAPLVAALLGLWASGERRRWPVVLGVVPACACGAAMAIITRLVQPAPNIVDVPLWARVPIALDTLGFYLWKAIVPTNLAIDYGRSPRVLLDGGWSWPLLAAPVALAAVAVLLRRRVPGLGIGLLVFVIALLPLLGFARFDFQFYSTVADRYAYVPLLGLAIGAAALLHHVPRRWALAGGGVVAAGLAVLSIVQTGLWQSDEALHRHALKVNPRSWMAHNNLATWLILSNRLPAALDHVKAAIAIRPDHTRAHFNWGVVLVRQGRLADAIEKYRKAAELEPANIGLRLDLADALRDAGRRGEAEAEYRAVLRLSPGHPRAEQCLRNLSL